MTNKEMTLEDFVEIEKKKLDVEYTENSTAVPINKNVVNALIGASRLTRADISRKMNHSSGWLGQITLGLSLIKIKDLKTLAEMFHQPSIDLLYIRRFNHNSKEDMEYLQKLASVRGRIRQSNWNRRKTKHSEKKDPESFNAVPNDSNSFESLRNDCAKMYIAFTNMANEFSRLTAQLQLNDERRQKEHNELLERINKQQNYLMNEIKKNSSSKITYMDKNKGVL